MQKLDRLLQLEILEYLKAKYPEDNEDVYLSQFEGRLDLLANLKYLYEHGLINADIPRPIDQPFIILVHGITAKGLDLLENDGGLSAILKTVIVKFEAEHIRSILEEKILTFPLDDQDRESALAIISKLPAEGLNHLMTKLIHVGLHNIPSLAQWLRSLDSGPTSPSDPEITI